MPEYTQEQIDQMLADAKSGLFSEDEVTRRVTAEVDRRVESGIQKGLETHKTKWQAEFEKTSMMTAEELAKEKMQEQLSQISSREKEIQRKANLLEAKDLLSDAGVPKSHYTKFIDLLVSEDDVVTKDNVSNFVDMFNQTKVELETEIKSNISKIPPPETGKDKPITKDDFNKMSYARKLDLKTKNPELYRQFMN